MITIKSEREIELLKKAGNIVYRTHQYLRPHIKPGITTKELDRLAEEFIRSQDATPSFKGYEGFPSATCMSVNDEVVHGFPSDYRLKEGDIIFNNTTTYEGPTFFLHGIHGQLLIPENPTESQIEALKVLDAYINYFKTIEVKEYQDLEKNIKVTSYNVVKIFFNYIFYI